MEQDVSASIFHGVTDVGMDPVFGLDEVFLKDPRKNKITLLAGVCLDEDGGAPKIYRAVRLAEKEIYEIESTKTYLPIDGDREYVTETQKMIFGDHHSDRIYGAQTQGGTSALNIGCEFLKDHVAEGICTSSPTWANHAQIFHRVGINFDYYPYWDGQFDFEKMVQHLKQVAPRTAILLQPMCHNPTGHDLTTEQWETLSNLFHEKKIIPFFDTAYQGFGHGIEEDAKPIRLMLEHGHEFIVAHSFSKSMGIYGERVGAFFIVMRDCAQRDKLARKVKSIIRTDYSNPSKHGAFIAKFILKKPELYQLWQDELKTIRDRIQNIRSVFSEKLSEKIPSKSFDYIKNGRGFFSLLGLSKEQVDKLREEHAIYMAHSSRINLAAINQNNIDIIVDAIAKV